MSTQIISIDQPIFNGLGSFHCPVCGTRVQEDEEGKANEPCKHLLFLWNKDAGFHWVNMDVYDYANESNSLEELASKLPCGFAKIFNFKTVSFDSTCSDWACGIDMALGYEDGDVDYVSSLK